MAQRTTGGTCVRFAQLATLMTVVLAALLCLVPTDALALGMPDTSQDCTLTIKCTSGEDAVADARIELYCVAEFDEYGQFSLVDDFAGNGINLSELERASEWSQAARRLEISAKLAEVAPSFVTNASSKGVATFSGLECGLYLVGTSEGSAASGQTYASSAFLVSLPAESADRESWTYRISVEPKFELTSDGSDKGNRDDSSQQGQDARNGSGGLAGTGDISPVAAAAGIALIGIALMAASRINHPNQD